MAVRFDKSLRNEINRTVKNFNAKITRLEKRNVQLLPRRVYSDYFKSNFRSRKDLRRSLRRFQEFSRRGMEDVIGFSSGYVISRYQLTLLKKDVSAAKANLTREMKRIGAYDTPYKTSQSEDLKNLQAKYKLLTLNYRNLDARVIRTVQNIVSRKVYGEETLENRRKGFFKRLWKNARFANVSEERIQALESKLNQLSDAQLQTAAFSAQPLLAMAEFYIENDFIEQSPDDMLQRIEILEENIDEIVEAFSQR